MSQPFFLSPKQTVLRVLAAIGVGTTAAFSVLLFLSALQWITGVRLRQPALIGLLPWLGYGSVWLYEKFWSRTSAGFALILDEVHNPQVIIPKRMAPLVLLTTLLSHLGGASVGREGTAVQMAASLADQWARFWDLDSRQRGRLLIAGASAGFAAAVGAPWAGVIFGWEVMQKDKRRVQDVGDSLVAAFTAYSLLALLGWEHTEYPAVTIPELGTGKFVLSIILLGLGVGGLAHLFVKTTHIFEIRIKQLLPNTRKRLLGVGFFLVFAYAWEGSYRFVGLGIEEIHRAFLEPSVWSAVWGKLVFTILSVGSGFKGGEFVPLIFMGSSFGNNFAQLLGLPLSYAAALGAVACFGAAANAPLTSCVMAMELFGWKIGLSAFLVCYLAYLVSPAHGVYDAKKEK